MTNKVEEFANKLQKNAIGTLKRLDAIWDELGLDNDTRENRNYMFFKHVEDLFNEMLLEANDCKANLLENIESLCKELSDLGRDLRIDIPVEGYEKVPLCKVKQELKTKLQKYQQEYDLRKKEIKNLLTQEKMLCKTLGKTPKELQMVPLPSREELLVFQTYLEELSDLKFRREELFFKRKARIIEIMDELKIKPSLDFERKIVECQDSVFTATDENIHLLEQFHKSLENQLVETKSKITELRERITLLWERLEESPQVRSEFLESHSGNSVKTMLDLKAALLKLEERKKANIKLFVDKMRQELVFWWNKCRSSPLERADFLHFQCDVYSEDLLTLHEIQIEKLKNHYENNISIYNMYSKRENMWKKMVDLEHRASMPDRYKNRGGQLLIEEKERKTISTQLPKIENELLELVKQFEEENNTPFLIFGERIENVIEQAWQQYTESKKLHLSVKKKLRENVGTPSKSPYIGCQSQLTPSISSSKRKLDTPMQGTLKRSRIESTFKSSSSRLQILNTTKKRTSLDKQRRREKVRKQIRLSQSKSLHATATNYENFQLELETKSSCRSSVFPDQLTKANKTPQRMALLNVNSTPQRKALLHVNSTPQRKILMNVNNTPQRKALLNINGTPQKTPNSRLRLQSKNSTLFLTTRLATAPSNLPILI